MDLSQIDRASTWLQFQIVKNEISVREFSIQNPLKISVFETEIRINHDYGLLSETKESLVGNRVAKVESEWERTWIIRLRSF